MAPPDDTGNSEQPKTSEPIQVAGIGAADIASKLVNIPAPLAVMTPVKFGFRSDDVGNKRQTVTLNLPFMTADGLVAAASDPTMKQLNLILDLCNDAIKSAARDQVNDEKKPVNSQDELDLSKLTFEAIANMPKSERTGGGIAKEVWEDLAKDYIAIMPGLTGKDVDKVTNAAKIIISKFQPARDKKPVLTYLKEQLALWYSKTSKQEDFQEAYAFLAEKVDALLAVDEATLLQNL